MSPPTIPQWMGMPLFLFAKLNRKYIISKVDVEVKLVFYGTWFMFPTYRYFSWNFNCLVLTPLNHILRHAEGKKL